jgi:hypothetical protein
VQITFENKFPFPVEIRWHEELGVLLPFCVSFGVTYFCVVQDAPFSQGYMSAGESLHISSMIGHVFSIHRVTVADDEYEERPIVDYFAVHELIYTFSPANRLETCEMDTAHCKTNLF